MVYWCEGSTLTLRALIRFPPSPDNSVLQQDTAGILERLLTLVSEILVTRFMKHHVLKGKFSSGIERALASTLNRDFNWKQLSEIILCIFLDVFKAYLSNIDSETAEI